MKTAVTSATAYAIFLTPPRYRCELIGNRAQAIVHAEAALKIYEQIEDPKSTKVREQLTRWCGQTEKKWRQFWK